MELNTKLSEMREVQFVVAQFKKASKSAAEDVVCAYNILVENNPRLDRNLLDSIHDSYIMCATMEPDVEVDDVISMLLFRDNLRNGIGAYVFLQKFREKRGEYYYRYVNDACRNAPSRAETAREECIAYYIMMRVCRKMFDRMMYSLNKKRVPNAICISRAYDLAYKAHYWAYRQSGEPYIAHPIKVAEILAEIGVDSQVIAAALLHDVAEDTDYTLADIEAYCGESGKIIARYVDAVTSLHRQYAASHRRDEYQCDKEELDQKSFQKLVEAVSSNPDMIFALYIKAADRIHNLRTLDAMPCEKRLDKSDETELKYLPLFKQFKMHYFVSAIEDLTWRASDIERAERIKKGYLDLCSRNADSIEEMGNILKVNLGTNFNRLCLMNLDARGFDVDVTVRKYAPYEVYKFIEEAHGSYVVPEKSIDKKIVPICDFDVILDPLDNRSTLDVFATIFVKMFVERIAGTGRTIVDFVSDGSHRFIVKIEDKYRNVFRCCFSTREDYIANRIGGPIGFAPEGEDIAEDIDSGKIHVLLRNGKVLTLPKGATVLDVSFAIHEEVGYCAKSALINGQRASIFNILQDGAQVVVEADTYRENGITKKFIPHVRINWLNSVATKEARKKIVRYLSSKYEPDDPRFMSSLQEPVAETVSEKYSAGLREIYLATKK